MLCRNLSSQPSRSLLTPRKLQHGMLLQHMYMYIQAQCKLLLLIVGYYVHVGMKLRDQKRKEIWRNKRSQMKLRQKAPGKLLELQRTGTNVYIYPVVLYNIITMSVCRKTLSNHFELPSQSFLTQNSSTLKHLICNKHHPSFPFQMHY